MCEPIVKYSQLALEHAGAVVLRQVQLGEVLEQEVGRGFRRFHLHRLAHHSIGEGRPLLGVPVREPRQGTRQLSSRLAERHRAEM